MHFLVIYMGLCVVSSLIMLILFKFSPDGWQDENGFHLINEKEKLITFPLQKKVAGNYHTVHFNLAHHQKFDKKRRSGLQITLA